MKTRCSWAGSDPLYMEYHDTEWGVPLHNDRKLFEMLILEGAQAGLSWITVLRKRENYRKAFDGFDPKKIAVYDNRKIRSLLSDPGIIRNKLKIEASVENAKAFLSVKKEFGTFDKYVWRFVNDVSLQKARKGLKHVPAITDESIAMSNDLKHRGFNFVGATICYAFMQATGMVNDHVTDCYRYKEIKMLNP